MKPGSASRQHPQILVVGPGSIGTVFAVRLADAGFPVTILDRRAERAQQIRDEGLTLMTDDGPLHAECGATCRASEAGPIDLAFVCVKGPALEDVGRALAELPGAATVVALQNGLGVVEALARGMGSAVGRHTLLRAVTYQAASPGPNSRIRHVANLETVLDGAGPLHDAADRVAGWLNRANLPARVEEDLRPTLWHKLVANAAINPLTALAGVANGGLLDDGDLRDRMLLLARETAAAARAEGVAITDGEAERIAAWAAEATRENTSSMRQDVEAGRPTEIDLLNGAVLRIAEHHGLDLPETRRVTEAIRGQEQQR